MRSTVKKIRHGKNMPYHDNDAKLLVLTYFRARRTCQQVAARTCRLNKRHHHKELQEAPAPLQRCLVGCLVSQFASIRFCSYWLGYREAGVNAAKRNDIIIDIFFISLDSVLPAECTRAPASVSELTKCRASSRGICSDDRSIPTR